MALLAYRLPRWAGQENYVELWVEKDALAGVLQPIAERWHITLMVNRGPPNPAKLSDSRAQAYVAQHGASSWEVDALQPEVLQQIIETAIQELVDVNTMNAVKAQEERDKDRLRKAAERF